MRSTCETTGSDLAGKHGPFPIQQTQREVTHVHEPKVADKNTPYWWEAAPVMALPPQPLASVASSRVMVPSQEQATTMRSASVNGVHPSLEAS